MPLPFSPQPAVSLKQLLRAVLYDIMHGPDERPRVIININTSGEWRIEAASREFSVVHAQRSPYAEPEVALLVIRQDYSPMGAWTQRATNLEHILSDTSPPKLVVMLDAEDVAARPNPLSRAETQWIYWMSCLLRWQQNTHPRKHMYICREWDEGRAEWTLDVLYDSRYRIRSHKNFYLLSLSDGTPIPLCLGMVSEYGTLRSAWLACRQLLQK